MYRKFTHISDWLYQALASTRFFYASLGLFSLGSLFVAIVSKYPMAFDEDFHFGIIKIYAANPVPWNLHATPAMARFGNVTHDPSWLYHYVMSFPYDVLHFFGLNETAIIFGLRCLNIILFVAGIILVRHLLHRMRISAFFTNLIIALWLLIPITTQIAGQINYDNLFLPLIASAFLLAITCIDQLKKHSLSLRTFTYLLIVLLVGCAVKYAFLPIAVGIMAVLVTYYFAHHYHITWSNLTKKISRRQAILLSLGLVLALCINFRYPANLLEFKSINPSCDLTYTSDDCMQYGVYARNANYKIKRHADFVPKDPVTYFAENWLPGTIDRLFFAVAGPTNDYDAQEPATLPIMLYSWVWIGLLLIAIIRLKTSLTQPYFALFIVPAVIYTGALFLQVYDAYRDLAEPVALNGRYFVPLIPIFFALTIPAFKSLRTPIRYHRLTPVLVSMLIMIIVLSGGGITTYLVRSKPSWFYDGAAQKVTNTARSILKPVTPLPKPKV